MIKQSLPEERRKTQNSTRKRGPGVRGETGFSEWFSESSTLVALRRTGNVESLVLIK